ncbi:MAG TPA: hypothetical protein VHB72_03460 [Candidatus Saccharimonadales bacterium]|nr:hypothetical protein [Candidatus Saccharimonadales bacterium]
MDAARIGGAIANFCDHSEHAEETDRPAVVEGARELIELAFEIADFEREDLLLLYTGRLAVIESESEFQTGELTDSPPLVAAGEAETLRDLQEIQIGHSLRFSPDIMGLSRANQLRHHSLRVSMLVGALAEQARHGKRREEFITQEIPDVLATGLLISTTMHERLPDIPAAPVFFD